MNTSAASIHLHRDPTAIHRSSDMLLILVSPEIIHRCHMHPLSTDPQVHPLVSR